MNFLRKFNKNKGFTLLELLVVIAIIGMIASVVLASLNSARKKSRDAKRIADIREMRTALELYFNANNNLYPANATTPIISPLLNDCDGQPCIPAIATDPLGGNYPYFLCADSAAYHLGAGLEESSNPALKSDLNAVPAACAGSTLDGSNDATQSTTACVASAAGGRYCYDVTP